MRPDQGLHPPDRTAGSRGGRHARRALVALAVAALMVAAARDASAQFGIGKGPGWGGAARAQGGAPWRGQKMPGAGQRMPGAGGTPAQGCRGYGCGRPGYPGRPGIIVGVPPVVGPPVVGSGQVVEDDLPRRPRPRNVGGNKPPGTGQTAQSPRSPGSAGTVAVAAARYLPDQIVCVLRAGISERQIDAFLREHRLSRTANGRHQIPLIGAELFRYRITDGRAVPRVVTALARDPRVVSAQANQFFFLAQAPSSPLPSSGPKEASAPANPALPKEEPRDATIERMQYAVGKLKLAQAHRVARGGQVLVAVIDSRIDAAHPELAGAIVREIDVIEDKDGKPHSHGTAMAGAIVAKSRLMGVAPEAQVIAVRAFSVTSQGAAAGTSFDLTRAIDRAVAEGARIINLSFAGPADPLLSRALKAAHEKGVVLIAAAGNAGPRSGPLHPAADPSVIAVTATDADDKIYRGANRGKHIAVAAPGVDILVAGPQGAYEMSTGTSVAAAHVSGIAALLMTRNPALGPGGVRQILMRSARDLGAAGPDEEFGAGLADAYQALATADPKAAEAVPAAGAPAR